MTEEQIARFWSKVSRGSDNACWDWKGTFNDSGYGCLSIGNRQRRAHRVSLLIAGQMLCDDLVVDHICRNRACVNPAHLRAVDRATNVHENSSAPAHLNSLKQHCPRGHALSGQNLVMDRGKRRCRICRNQALKDLRARKKRLGPKDDGPVAEGHAPALTEAGRLAIKDA